MTDFSDPDEVERISVHDLMRLVGHATEGQMHVLTISIAKRMGIVTREDLEVCILGSDDHDDTAKAKAHAILYGRVLLWWRKRFCEEGWPSAFG